MCRISLNSENWIMYALSGMSFFRFPLSLYGYEINNGVILVADDDSQAKALENALIRTFGAIPMAKYNKKEQPLNYELGIHRYRKRDREEELEDFLTQRSFFPVAIVGGIVPKVLRDKGYIMKCCLPPERLIAFGHIYSLIKEASLANIDYWCQELKVLKTSKLAKEYLNKKSSPFICYMLAVAKIYWGLLRKKIDEDEADAWIKKFMSFAKRTEENMERLNGFYSVKEAVKNCTLKFILQNKTPILETYDSKDNEVRQCIYADQEYYYIAEEFMKKMCLPLLETISFVQLKIEMAAEGMLVTDNVPGNFTVKIQLYDAETGLTRRLRFLRLQKMDFISDEGLLLEDLQKFTTDESKEEKDEDWRNEKWNAGDDIAVIPE